MRGKAQFIHVLELHVGITPAHAGKRRDTHRYDTRFRDHPRACGEKFNGMTDEELQEGSPPRMRGKVCSELSGLLQIGITPAHAGKRRGRGRERERRRDHPRTCGEKRSTTWRTSAPSGSPPRMRGQGDDGRGFVLPDGITPAYAGKSAPFQKLTTQSWDHPRVCGEKPGVVISQSLCGGSPPRMRGKDSALPHGTFCHRITPAYAGKRLLSAAAELRHGDHPRVCGEKLFGIWIVTSVAGSPPRMRGKAGGTAR